METCQQDHAAVVVSTRHRLFFVFSGHGRQVREPGNFEKSVTALRWKWMTREVGSRIGAGWNVP